MAWPWLHVVIRAGSPPREGTALQRAEAPVPAELQREAVAEVTVGGGAPLQRCEGTRQRAFEQPARAWR